MRVVSKMSGTEEKHVCNPRAVTLPLPADKAAAHHTLHVSSARYFFPVFPDPTCRNQVKNLLNNFERNLSKASSNDFSSYASKA